MQKGQLELRRCVKNDRVIIHVIVRGNVGDEGRAVLDRLGMTPLNDIANCRGKYVETPSDLDTLRNALLSSGFLGG